MEIRLLPLSAGSTVPARAESLYLSAFPACERRPVEEWRKTAEEVAAFHFREIRHGGEFAGFITYWTFRPFIYVEHFAVHPGMRGQGIGGLALEALKAQHPGSPLVLEVELPETEEARRRVAFYTRHGFSPVPLPYLQPPYRPGEDWFPLSLMSTDEAFATTRFAHIRQTVYREVYHTDLPAD